MDTLTPDIVLYMALNMDVPEVLSLCETSTRFNSIICQNQRFWMNKIITDFPTLASRINEYGPDYYQSYRTLAYRFVQIDLVLNLIDSDDPSPIGDGETETIDAVSILKLRTNLSDHDAQQILYIITKDILKYLPWGYYSIQVDNQDTECQDLKNMYADCFQDFNQDSRSVTILFDSYEPESVVYYRNELQNILDDSIQRGKARFYGL